MNGRRVFAWLLLALAVVLSAVAAFAVEKRSVLVIESYHKEYAWDRDYRDALIEKLGDRCDLEFFELDTKRLPVAEQEKRADMARARIEEARPDLVVLGDDAALKFLGPLLAKSGTPTVYLGINGNPRNAFEDKRVPDNFTGVLERPLFKRFILIMDELVGGARSCLILFDASITSEIVKEEIFGGKDSAQVGSVRVDLELLKTFDEWKEAVTKSKGERDFIVTGLYQAVRDAEDKSVLDEDVIRWVSENSSVPVFGFWDFSIGKGKAAGGLVLDGREQGLKAAAIIERHFSGTALKDIPPVTENKGKFLFSAAELARWNLTLPESVRGEATIID